VVTDLEEMIKSEITLMWDKHSDILQRIKDKLQMQEKEISITAEGKRGIDVELYTDFSTSVQQQTSTSVNHSINLDGAASLFSILPSAADIGNINPEEEQPLRKPKKKKKGRSIG
jgi:hypothetical protein